MSLSLRPYQSDVVSGVRNSFKEGFRAPLAVLPTGGGKTIVFCHIAENVATRGKRALILVHRVELLRQTSRALMKNGVRHGLIHPSFTPNAMEAVQVASVQTLVKRLHIFKNREPDLIVIDEAHHATAGTWRKIIEAFPKALLLGVTATPCRGDGTGLGKDAGGMFDTIVEGPQIEELINMGWLVRPVVYAPMERVDLSGIRIRMGDYEKKELNDRMDKPTITGNAVSHYQRLCPGTPAVAFCVSITHAEHVAEEFRRAGFRAYAVDGGMDDKERTRILNGLGNGSVDIVCSCDLISEGTDIPAIGCAILLRPTKSLGLFIQQVGRALRPCEGKDRAIILDHVGNVITHGMPEEFREWSLEGETRKRKKDEEKEKTIRTQMCPKCYAIHLPAPACTQCGNIYFVEEKKLREVDGELREITEADKDAIRKARKREEAQCKTLDQLRELANRRGYKPGWAENRWKYSKWRQNLENNGAVNQ